MPGDAGFFYFILFYLIQKKKIRKERESFRNPIDVERGKKSRNTTNIAYKVEKKLGPETSWPFT